MDPFAQSEILSSSSSPSSSLAPSEHFPGRKKGQKDGGNAFRSHPRADAPWALAKQSCSQKSRPRPVPWSLNPLFLLEVLHFQALHLSLSSVLT